MIRFIITIATKIIANDKYSGLILKFFVEIVGNLLASRKAIIAKYINCYSVSTGIDI